MPEHPVPKAWLLFFLVDYDLQCHTLHVQNCLPICFCDFSAGEEGSPVALFGQSFAAVWGEWDCGGLYLNPGVVRPVSITPTPSPKPKTELMSQGLLDQLVISTTDGISPCHAASVVLQALLFLLTHSFSMLCYLPMWQSRTMSRAFICCRDSMRQTVYLYCYH